MTDPIADMLTRIRNASLVKATEVSLPLSKLKHNIAKILVETHWLDKAEVFGDEAKPASRRLKLTLKYRDDGRSVISSIRRVSKPSHRIYVDKKSLPRVLNNLGLAIISTPSGLMTNKEAGKRGLGGEVICEIY